MHFLLYYLGIRRNKSLKNILTQKNCKEIGLKFCNVFLTDKKFPLFSRKIFLDFLKEDERNQLLPLLKLNPLHL